MDTPSQSELKAKILELTERGLLINQPGIIAHIIDQLGYLNTPTVRADIINALGSLRAEGLVEFDTTGFTFNVIMKRGVSRNKTMNGVASPLA